MANALLSLLDRLSDSVLLIARDGRLAHANPTALRSFALEVGSAWPQALPVVGRDAVDWVAERLARPEQAAEAEVGSVGGRRLSMIWQALDERYAALHLQWVGGAAAPAEGSPVDGRAMATAAPSLAVVDGAASPPPAWIRVFDHSPFPVMVQGPDQRLVLANQALCRFSAYPHESLIGMDPVDLVHPDDRSAFLALHRGSRPGPAHADLSASGELRLVDANGRERWFRSSRHVMPGAAGEHFVLSILQDCTGEHMALARADRFLRELDQWFDLATVGMVLFDASGLLVRTNHALENLLGDVPVQISDAPLPLQRLLGWHRDGFAARSAGGAWHGNAVLERADGTRRSLHAIVRAYPVAAGQRRFLAVVEDRSAEEERDLVQSQMGTLMDTAGVGLVTLQGPDQAEEPDRPITAPGDLDRGDVRLSTGVLQSISRDVVLPDSLPQYERLQAALREGQRAEVRYAIRHPQVGVRWLLTRVEPSVSSTGRRSTSVVTLDITETQQAQNRGEQLLRELTTILEGTTAGIAYVRGDVLVRCNPRFEAMLGLPGGRAVGSSLHELFGRFPQAHRLAAETLQALTESGVYETEIELNPGSVPLRFGEPVDSAGVRWASLSVRRAAEPTPLPEAILVLTDITRLKSQQRELEVLLRDRDLMFSMSEVGIAFIRGQSIQRANDALGQLSGYRVDELARLRIDSLFPTPDDFEREWPVEQEALTTTGRWTGERQLRCRDGRTIWVQVSKRLVLEGESEAGIIASYVNVDERRRAQEAVAIQAERTRAVLDSVLVGIVTVGPQGIEWMNRSARRMFAGDLADFIGLPISTVSSGEADHPFLQTRYLDELLEGQAETFECRVKARDGREFWVVGNVVAIGEEAHERQLTYALLDIERRRQAEVRIVETQASLQRIIEAAPMAITLVDAANLRVMQANQAAAAASGRAVDDLIGLRPDDWMPELLAQRHLEEMHAALNAATPTQSETRVGEPGAERVWETRYVPVSTPGRPADQLLVVSTDVTEQRLAQEARFEAALTQREMLVKEVHHRIKNNLQGVAGLLEQIAKRKPEVANTIAEVVGQVQAIAQVYGLQVGVSGALRVQSVVLAITQSVERTFGRPIRCDVGGVAPEGWVLPEAEAIPIALSLNELLTNAIKHSPAGEPVVCRLQSQADEVQVSVVNRGQVPEGFRLERFPMGVSGLGLVRALLPRRSASLLIETQDEFVVATLRVRPPGVKRDNALSP